MKNWTYPAPLQVVWLAVVFFMNSARALDTYEVYAPGLSDFEAYTTQSRHNFLHEAIVGYGLNDYVNPTLWLSFFGEQGGANIDETIRLMNVSTIYDGALKIDLLPMLDYSPEAKTWVAALVTEVNFPISRWEPFFIGTFRDPARATGRQPTWDALVALKYLYHDGVELFFGGQAHTDPELSPRVAAGCNFLATKDLEVILEGSVETALARSSSLSLGLIYTR